MSDENIINSTGITSENIDTVIRSLRKQLDKADTYDHPSGFIFPVTYRGKINRKKYKGRGRPKYEDYFRHSTMNLLKSVHESKL